MFGKRGSTGAQASKSQPSRDPVAEADKPIAEPSASGDAGRDHGGRDTSDAPKLGETMDTHESRPISPEKSGGSRSRSEEYYDIKTQIFSALIDTIDLSQLGRLEIEAAREEIRDIVSDIIALKNVVMSIAEQEDLLEDIWQRRARLRPAGTAAGPRRHRRYHGQWRGYDLYRSLGQGPRKPGSSSATISN